MGFKISLKAARVNALYGQQQAADLLGISVRTLRYYEADQIPVPEEILAKAADLYGIETDKIKVNLQ